MPKKNLPASWVHRTLGKLNLNIFDSTRMYTNYDYDQFESKLKDALAWIEDSELMTSETKEHFESLVHSLSEQAEEATEDGPVYAGGNEYIIAAEISAEDVEARTTVPYPVDYATKERYWPDRQPEVEEMVTTPLVPGEIMKLTWANGDDYDGLSYRVGVERKLQKAIVDYLKKLGLWDIIHETMYDNPLQEDSTRFHRLPSPYDPSRTMTWGVKRPSNYDESAVSLASSAAFDRLSSQNLPSVRHALV